MIFFRNYPNLTVAISCLFWGTYWIPLRYIDNNNNGSIWLIFISFLLLSLFLIIPLLKSIKNLILNKNKFFFFGCFFASLGIAFYSESLLRGDIARVVVLFYLCPIWGTLFARIFLGDKLTINRLIAIIIGLLGLEIIVGIERGIIIPTSVVDWIALLAGMSWALGMTCFHLAKSTSAFEKTALTSFLIPFIFLLICLIPGGRTFELPSISLNNNLIYIWVIFFAIAWLLPSILLTYFSVEILDPGRINILLAFEVVVGFLSATLLTNEIIGTREILGAVFVVSACFIDIFFNKIFYLNQKRN